MRGAAGVDLAVGILHAGEAGRRDRERQRKLLAQHRGLQAALRHVDQHALAQLDRLHVVDIGVARMLGVGAGLHVVEEHARHVAARHPPQVFDAHRAIQAHSHPVAF